jgi:hypothetical protein
MASQFDQRSLSTTEQGVEKMAFRIDWKSTSQWVGTERTEEEGSDIYATREEAEAALAEMEKDQALMQKVNDSAVQGQGAEGWLEIEECDDDE